jgi:hypothetical protein
MGNVQGSLGLGPFLHDTDCTLQATSVEFRTLIKRGKPTTVHFNSRYLLIVDSNKATGTRKYEDLTVRDKE